MTGHKSYIPEWRIKVLSKFSKSGKDDAFQNAWFSAFRNKENTQAEKAAEPAKKLSPVAQNLEDIKQYAYSAFDSLDRNGNGFIETHELTQVLDDASVGMREKSFITFLLNHQSDIADTVQEGHPEHADGISRLDLEKYFRILITQVEQNQ